MISAVEQSENAKLGRISATYAPQQTCPSTCPLINNGCYAERGLVGIITRRLNRTARATKKGLAKLRILLAEQEAEKIRNLSGKNNLRVHVVGDCATPTAAKIIGRAMVRHETRRWGQAAWTYTHAWRKIPLAAWQGARVLASCQTPAEVKQALAKGYAAALITPVHPTNKVYQYGGLNILPCPAQFKTDGKRTVTCEDCTICQNPAMLRARNLVLGFQPDGTTRGRVLRMIADG
jgi:hypothetical protein